MREERTYHAKAFAPQTGSRVHGGTLRVLPSGVHFESAGAVGELPFMGMRVRRGGHNDEQVFFEHPSYQGWSIYSSDPNLLQDPTLRATPEYAEVLRGVERARRAPPAALYAALVLAALVLGAIALVWLAKDRIAEAIANRVPVRWEEKLGDQVFAQIAGQGKVLTNSPWQPKVEAITGRLLPAAGKSGYHFRFHVLQDTNVNAFAIPGGNVVILTGLLEQAATSEEVAGVLAHELAHVTRRHSLRNIVKSAGLVLLIQALLGDASGLASVAVEGSRYMLQQKFSRDFEREADDVGWNYLVEAQIDPRGMIQFFEKIKRLAAQSGSGAMDGSLAFLSTHPASTERIERLSARWDALANKGQFRLLPPLRQKEP